MVRINQLQNLDPDAWTLLLEQDPDIQGTKVTAVQCEKSGNNHRLTRYLLTLAGYSEPITLLGKETNELETQFYQTIASNLSLKVPKCWFSHLDGDQSWIIISEVYNDWPPCHWAAEDIEAIIEDMAVLHAAFWNQKEQLEQFDWPLLLPKPSQRSGRQRMNKYKHSTVYGPEREGAGQQSFLHSLARNNNPLVSDHAAHSAGSLTPLLVRAAEGLERIQLLGGWPNIFEEQHIQAVVDLLDDPVPMLQPLQEMPATLLHGNLSPAKWQFNLFNERYLLDWERMTTGPAVMDLVQFIEEFDLLADESGWRIRSCWPLLEETMVDSYILRMGGKLGSSFNATHTRRAMPAARCLYVLTTWLPRFASWFQSIPDNRQAWHNFNQLCDEELAEAGFELMVGIRPYLTNLFQRFLNAYRML
jgi:hypothetical protein